MPGNENTKSGILQGSFICRTSELNPRLTLTRIPIILGTGKPLFRNTLPEIIVKPLHTRSFASGLVQSDYEVV